MQYQIRTSQLNSKINISVPSKWLAVIIARLIMKYVNEGFIRNNKTNAEYAFWKIEKNTFSDGKPYLTINGISEDPSVRKTLEYEKAMKILQEKGILKKTN